MDYDVIVCGGGPAGATAARVLAQGGMRTALVEKEKLPRHKTCGGGVPNAVSTLLGAVPPEQYIEAHVTRVRHTLDFGSPVLAEINHPGESDQSLWMVDRAAFDEYLVRLAAQAGADVLEQTQVMSLALERSGCNVTVKTQQSGANGVILKAKHIIGADGANGICARCGSLRRKRSLAIAVETEMPFSFDSGHEFIRQDTAHLEFGAVRAGYAWIFPKRGKINVGAGAFNHQSAKKIYGAGLGPALRQAVVDYLRALDVPVNPPELRFWMHPLPIWAGREPLSTPDGELLLAGDAAGLINPFFGDGIMHAVRSGKIAADCLLNDAPGSYTAEIHACYARNFDAAYNWMNWFYRFPRAGYKIGVSRESATRTAMRLLSGDLLWHDVAPRLRRRLIAYLLQKPLSEFWRKK